MDFMLALNVTIYGLGIVFLALLVLMVAIMILGKAFAVATGRDLLPMPPAAEPAAARTQVTTVAPPPLRAAPVTAPAPTPAEAAEAVNAPLPGKVLSVAVAVGARVRRGDELCVIEAMKMGNSVRAPRDGFVVEVCVAQGATVAFGAPLVFLAASPTAASSAARPAAPAPAGQARPSAFTLSVDGKTHAVEIAPADRGALAVLLDGGRYDVRHDAGDPSKVIVNGAAHTVEVKEIAGASARVVVDGVTHKLEIGRSAPAPPQGFSLVSGGTSHTVEVAGGDGAASVMLDGATHRVERDRANPDLVLVNGQAHTVAVTERTGNTVTVVIDGRTERLEIAPDPGAAQPSPARGAVPPPAVSATGGRGTPVNAPLPGKILSVAVKAGDRVKPGDELCVIEAMKMANSVKAPREGTVVGVLIAPGQTVAFGAALLMLD